MTRLAACLVLSSLLLTACRGEPSSEPPAADAPGPASPAPHAPPDAPPPAAPEPLAASLVRAEWRKAGNRASCAPLALTSDGGAPGLARRARFAGGWAVAIDTPEIRSAYGLAGPDLLAADAAPPAEQAERLGAQWPHFTTLADLPAPAFAGYGVEGALDFPPDNPDGRGLNALAYVRVGGEQCTYNVWSRLGRAHLEVLLGSLRKLEP